MRFLDANVFIYAYYKPKRQLTHNEKQMKENAKKIISNVTYALTVDFMRQNDMKEFYSFDEHFNDIEGLKRLPQP
jgi:predicted nucleic acid-binding protein